MTDDNQKISRPITDSPKPVGQTEPAQQPTTDASLKSSCLGRILLVEDDPPMVRMYSTKLTQEGFEVEVAYDGEEGLRKVQEYRPDLLVLDLMIPKIGGLEILARLRAEAATKPLPVIVLSNLSQDQDVAKARELGAVEYLVKANFTPGQVVEKIKAVLKK